METVSSNMHIFEKIQKGGSNAPSLGSESKYAKDLDDPKLNAAVFKEKGQKKSPKRRKEPLGNVPRLTCSKFRSSRYSQK